MLIKYSRAILEKSIIKFSKKGKVKTTDQLVVEEPLEIRLRFFQRKKWQNKSLAVTMRTPDNDVDLALGFLFTEGILANKKSIDKIIAVEDNVLLVRLLKNIQIDLPSLERNFYATSSCGICGKASIDKLEKVSCFFPEKNLPKVRSGTIINLPALLRNQQSLFEETGGIHAAGLFTPDGQLIAQSEDVGRHNAVDKLIGACLQNDLIPLRQHLLMLSGRVGFELVQKAVMAGIPIIAAVGAPSSLAVELAEESGMTLIGFLREERFNVYCGEERIIY
ncbi:MAG: formate dehydrogenase accessory sulfurtransferase FdhD [Bacteroidota bacterium]